MVDRHNMYVTSAKNNRFQIYGITKSCCHGENITDMLPLYLMDMGYFNSSWNLEAQPWEQEVWNRWILSLHPRSRSCEAEIRWLFPLESFGGHIHVGAISSSQRRTGYIVFRQIALTLFISRSAFLPSCLFVCRSVCQSIGLYLYILLHLCTGF